MSPTSIILVCLVSCTLAAPQAASNPIESIIEGIEGAINDTAEGIKQGVVVPGFQVLSDACQAVKKVVVPIETHGRKADVNNLTIDFVHEDGSLESYNINDAADEIPKSKGFNPEQKVYLYIHGYTDNPSKSSFGNLSEAFLSTGKSNVLALDSSSLTGELYLRSSDNAEVVGQKLAQTLVALNKEGVAASQIHVIGHSLGGQIAGFTGQQFFNLTGTHLGRITGLDPAGPCFTDIGEDKRLSKTDADFVDIIHTDAGLQGISANLGDVDFWPNSGANQPNCKLTDSSCSHHRAWQLYSESIINPQAFPAVQCNSWNDFKKGKCSKDIAYMGFPAKQGLSGNYYLQTAGTAPYSLGTEGTTYHDD